MKGSIQKERVMRLNARSVGKGRFVLYWMQAAQRAECNHALEYAIERANELGLPVVVFFGLTGSYPEANARHYRFMLEGLRETERALAGRGIRLVARAGSPEALVVPLAKDASLVVVDRESLRLPREWRFRAAGTLACPLLQVETNVVVPIEEASAKEEYAAATIRPKIRRALERFLVPLRERAPRIPSLDLDLSALDLSDVDALVRRLRVDASVPPSPVFTGGASEARRRLRLFIRSKLDSYPKLRNDPNAACTSDMSPYLHFGQISPLEIALEVTKSGSPAAGEYLEELIVRRELGMNYVYFNERYDSYGGLPEWARRTLREHARDRREYLYDAEDLENARTHDPYWNAAQNEMRITGKMHNYMRMYWGKKILEWMPSPETAFETALRLNNRWELDGRDAGGFAGVAWCFGKHDRPWKRRPVFGMIRYMNAAGLRRKFDADAYARRIEEIDARRANV
jgi:deoxyribodipyrimidine photo-lyase